MKKAVSISLGSSNRDWRADLSILGEEVQIERIGTDGDMQRAARMFAELDGQVDAFGVGGTDLGFTIDEKYYTLHSVQSLRRDIHKTPVVDGTGLKMTLECTSAQLADTLIEGNNKRVLIMTAVDRWGFARTFQDMGYQCIYGDLMFSLGLPFPVKSIWAIKALAGGLLPILSRLPFHWIYPVGEAQNKRTPRFNDYFRWASIIAGDCHYITRYMPDNLEGKWIVTNTTTPKDRDLFRSAGVAGVITSTPILKGRSFGTNMIEAALLAASGYNSPVDYHHANGYFQMISNLIKRAGLHPEVVKI